MFTHDTDATAYFRISTETNPADLNTICGTDAGKVQAQISKLCGSNTDAAMSAFSSTCSAAGKTVCKETLLVCRLSAHALLTVAQPRWYPLLPPPDQVLHPLQAVPHRRPVDPRLLQVTQPLRQSLARLALAPVPAPAMPTLSTLLCIMILSALAPRQWR
jgi:hypothetical protein